MRHPIVDKEQLWVDFHSLANTDGATYARRWFETHHPEYAQEFFDRYTAPTPEKKDHTAPISQVSSFASLSELEDVVPTQTSWAEQVIAEELPDPKPDIPTWKQRHLDLAKDKKLTKRQVERRQVKHHIWDYVDYHPTQEFTCNDLVPISGRKLSTVTEIVKELWAEGLVKGIIKTKTVNSRKGHKSCYYVITSLANPATHYYLQFPKDNPWFQKD
jgi:hypothetical protein